jgi:hypothetical protein
MATSKGFKKGEPVSGLMKTTRDLSERLDQHAAALELDELKRTAIVAAKAWESRSSDRDQRLTELLAAAIRFYEVDKLLKGIT